VIDIVSLEVGDVFEAMSDTISLSAKVLQKSAL